MVGVTYLIARCTGAPALPAILACCLLATTPAVWFFSTTIEVHALHGAVVALAALVCVSRHWRRPVVDTWVAGAATTLVFASHQSGALLQGAFAVAAYVSWRAADSALGTLRSVKVIAPAFTVALVCGVAIGRSWAADMTSVHQGGLLAFLLESRQPMDLAEVAAMWIPTLALLWVVILAPLCEPDTRRRYGLLAVAAFTPLLVFFTLQGVPERGAYAFGFLPFVTAVGARALSRLAARHRWLLAALAVAVLVQSMLARTDMRRFDDGSWAGRLAARGSHVRSLGAGDMLLISFDHRMQIIEATHPEIREVDFLQPLVGAIKAGESLEALAARFEHVVAPLLGSPTFTVVVDRGYALELHRAPELADAFRALEACMHSIATIESRPLGDHDYWVLRPRTGE